MPSFSPLVYFWIHVSISQLGESQMFEYGDAWHWVECFLRRPVRTSYSQFLCSGGAPARLVSGPCPVSPRVFAFPSSITDYFLYIICKRVCSRCSRKKLKETAYLSLVRPTLEYAASVWDPHLIKDRNSLEAVQRKAARFVDGDYRRRASPTHVKYPRMEKKT